MGPAFYVLARCAWPGARRLLGLLSLTALLANNPAQAQPPLPAITLQLGEHAIQAELADTPATLQAGLMDRPSMPANAGMLFMLGPPGVQCFWMKNTLIPLSIAFIDEQHRIVSIQDMQPHDLTPHCSPSPVAIALEMNQGWFERTGIQTGDPVRGIPAPR
ncbi:MAG: DUF192 domain-containing protein [Castellaniella sp.]|uniref:DUF192 domain-containing protein n=1 Tax=Castellaniella sp. TaxID=1955812 RepID=UPI003C766256